MSPHTSSSREFDAEVSNAMRLAAMGPVFILENGEPAYVLLTFEEYIRVVHGDDRSKRPSSAARR